MKKYLPFLIFIIFLVGIFLIVVYQQEKVLRDGDSYILATRPVDPRDLFRGEYVILRYAIERDERVVEYLSKNPIGYGNKTVYVKLSPNTNGIAEVAAIQYTEPTPLTGWIKGEASSRNSVRFPSLEQFYVPEGAGLPIERMRNDLHVEISINDSDARIVQLLDEHLNPIDPKSMLPQKEEPAVTEIPTANVTPQPEPERDTTPSTTHVDLSNRGLTTVPQEIFRNTDTEVLSLSGNNLSGALPAEVRQLTKLRELHLDHNNFTGVPAEIGQLTQLEILNLANNPITGLPYELGNLQNLLILDLSGTNYASQDLEIIKAGLPEHTMIIVD